MNVNTHSVFAWPRHIVKIVFSLERKKNGIQESDSEKTVGCRILLKQEQEGRLGTPPSRPC